MIMSAACRKCSQGLVWFQTRKQAETSRGTATLTKALCLPPTRTPSCCHSLPECAHMQSCGARPPSGCSQVSLEGAHLCPEGPSFLQAGVVPTRVGPQMAVPVTLLLQCPQGHLWSYCGAMVIWYLALVVDISPYPQII